MEKYKLSKKEQLRIEKYVKLDEEHYVDNELWLTDEQKEGVELLIKNKKAFKSSMLFIVSIILIAIVIYFIKK